MGAPSAATVPVVLTDPPYGTERSCDGPCLADAPIQRDDGDVRVVPLGRAEWTLRAERVLVL